MLFRLSSLVMRLRCLRLLGGLPECGIGTQITVVCSADGTEYMRYFCSVSRNNELVTWYDTFNDFILKFRFRDPCLLVSTERCLQVSGSALHPSRSPA
jgi:hypothetical protein